MAQDKTPKRGCRWPVVDNPHRSRLTRCPSHDWSSTAREAHQHRRQLRRGCWGRIPTNILVGGDIIGMSPPIFGVAM